MDFELSPEQQLLKQTAKDFADQEIMPGARERDRNAQFPEDIICRLGEMGFLGPLVPESYGGMGADFLSEAIIFEEVGRADSSVRTTLSVQISLCEAPILKYGSEAQKQKYLPRLSKGEWLGCFGLTEPQAGSDAANQQSTCRRDGVHWILNGHKIWISNGTRSRVALIFAQSDPSKKHRGVCAFLVETDAPGFQAYEIHGKLGLRSSSTAELRLTDVRVPDAQRLGAVGQGFEIAMYALDNGRFGVASGCVGIIQGCVDASVKYARERVAFNKPIAGFQLVQEMLADMYLDLEAARLLVYRAGAKKNTGDPAHVETSLAKWYASEAAVRAALNAIQVHGGYGYSDEYPVERYLRDAKVATLYEGTTQIQKLIIGRHLTGVSAFA